MKLRHALDEIQQAALAAVDPYKAVLKFLQRGKDHLLVDGKTYPLSDRRVLLAGVGKAAVPMAQAVETVLGDQLEEGMVIVKYGHVASLQKTKVLEGGHPEPDEAGCEAAQGLLTFLQDNLSCKDLLLVVISGGGSALLPVPVKEITFEEKRLTTSLLLKSEASIQEINTIRKHLSRIKGGRFMDFTQGAQLLVLLLSDVVGDDLASIASGPTSPDPTTFQDCARILQQQGIEQDLPLSVSRYLRAGGESQGPTETPKPGDSRFDRVHNVIVGCNIQALQAAANRARELGFKPLILSDSITGNTRESALMHVALARQVLQTGDPIPAPCCLISGGETTVRLTGDGKGGRNQEFTLWCARQIADWNHTNLLFSSLGSDGTDGPTDAAGAVASPETARLAAAKGLSIQDYLDRNDSYHFFQKVGGLITTGPTLTNVMDLRFVLIDQ
ncbi:MAG: glycerate kinase [Acidobacteriota bacterium]